MADELQVTRVSDLIHRVCVIGAGSSGLAACQALHGRGIPFDCFEAGSSVGGNWRYGNDNGMSSAYRSLHAKSSRRGMQYAAFPIPDGYPDYVSHELVARYLDDFADHFGFRGSIRFRTEVTRVEPAPGGGWDVTADYSRLGARTLIAVRAGAHIIPRYLAGRPADHLTLMRAGAVLPLWLRRFAAALLVRIARGDVAKYGLPKPGHRLLCGPLAVSDSLLRGLRRGEIAVKPAIDRFERDRVHFC